MGVVSILALLATLASVSGLPRDENGTCSSSKSAICVPGIVLPVWLPVKNLTVVDRGARATVYFLCMLYMFLGISLISDRFMAAIEVITSQEKRVTVRKKDGEVQVLTVRIWNETVSNLTLMALGSSAPEILLSIIEIIGKDYKAGDLGPGTIVGSAAYNLFVITGICILVIPDGQVKRIKHLSVFFITATWSVFAYLWLYLIIGVISKGEVEVWEAVLTFTFFPMTVITAYIADTKLMFKRFLRKRYVVMGPHGERLARTEMATDKDLDEVMYEGVGTENQEVMEFEKNRREFITILRDIRKVHPDADPRTVEELAQNEILSRGRRSRAFYQMQATRKMTGGGNLIKTTMDKMKAAERENNTDEEHPDQNRDPNVQTIFFDPGHYTVMENVGKTQVAVSRWGGNLQCLVMVDYFTVDGTATEGSDYISTKGSITFQPGETQKTIELIILDDEEFEEDEYFYVKLENIRVAEKTGSPFVPAPTSVYQLVAPTIATVMVLDDDHSGVFYFETPTMSVSEACGLADIKVLRSTGARGTVRIPYKTESGTATGGGDDYEDAEGEVVFENNETVATIQVRIINDEDYEKNEYFFIQLGEPHTPRKEPEARGQRSLSKALKKLGRRQTLEELEVAERGAPRLGECSRIKVIIMESTEFKNSIDKLLKKANLSLVVGTSSWREQFIEAITVSAGDPESDGEEQLPSCFEYVMHFLSLFWKVMFAFVPPTNYLGGWLCFCVSIGAIGVMTALVGDIASHFGCTVGLTDAVTAITFVALGTSLPDTFASKVAATSDVYADSSIGNVTGSNAVNVFLGLGIAWSLAAIVAVLRKEKFLVSAGSLGFSVTTFCVMAVIAIVVLLLRRLAPIGGELGGPKVWKYLSGAFYIVIWMVYIVVAGLENYCHIEGF